MQIEGVCNEEFQSMREAFAEGFHAGRDVGASLAVWQHGRLIVDLWAGYADRDRRRQWLEDTIVCFFSVSKAVTATCVLQAVDRGYFAIDDRVTDMWPEFGERGKEEVTVRHLLCHQAGLPGLRTPLTKNAYFDWRSICDALAREQPWWIPGTAHGYHARTFGFLLGEVLSRATGKTVGQWLQEFIAEPDRLDIHIGLADPEHERCADMLPAKIRAGEQKNWPAAMQRMMEDFSDRSTPTGAAFQNPAMRPGYMNTAEFRRAQFPAVNGHGTARSVAQLFGTLPDLLDQATFASAITTQSRGPDEVLKSRTHFGLGYMLFDSESPIGWPGCIGHAGAGGSVAFCDPARGLGFAFLMNQMQEGVVTGGTSATRCVSALADALGVTVSI